MAGALLITALLFMGFMAYIIGERISEIKMALICRDTIKHYRKEKEHFAVVRANA